MLSCIKEVKILLDNDNIFHLLNDNDEEEIQEEYRVLSLDDAKKYAMFIHENLPENNQRVEFSLIANNPFKIFETIISLSQFIQNLRSSFSVKIYIDGYSGTEEQYIKLKESNIKIKIEIPAWRKDLLSEERINLILKYFPLAQFICHISSNNSDFLSIWNYYKDFDIYYFDFALNYKKNYNEEDFNNFDSYLNEMDNYIINSFNSYSIPMIPEFYRYMMWKIGTLYYFENNSYYRQIPEGMNGVRCGLGCNQQIIINYNGLIFTCSKLGVNIDEKSLFCIGSIENGIQNEKIENLITLLLKEEVAPGYSVRESIVLKCKDCQLNKVCTAGCSPINFIKTNQFLTPPDSFCEWNKLFFNHTLNVVRYFDTYQNNDLFKDYYLGSLKRGEKNYVRCC